MEAAIIALLIIILVVLIVLFLKKPVAGNQHVALLALKEEEHQKSLNWLKEEKLRLEDELNDLRNNFLEERSKVIKSEETLGRTAWLDAG